MKCRADRVGNWYLDPGRDNTICPWLTNIQLIKKKKHTFGLLHPQVLEACISVITYGTGHPPLRWPNNSQFITSECWVRGGVGVQLLRYLHWYRSLKEKRVQSLPCNSHEWPRQNFSLLHLISIMQTSGKSKEEYQLWDY